MKHLSIVLAALLCGVSHASAGTILLPPNGGKAQVNFFEPIGQSLAEVRSSSRDCIST